VCEEAEVVVSEPKNLREIELLVKALDEVPDETEGEETVRRLGINVTSWTSDIRARVARANAEARQQRFDAAKAAYEADLGALGARPSEPARSKEEQQRILRDLVARAPQSATNAIHFHKFEEATGDELAEMIRSLRHLLREDDE
jgi:hypothetical protein